MDLPVFEDNSVHIQSAGHKIEIILYTDPLCCWSWALQPGLTSLKSALGEQASWSLKMGGLISSWENFHDETNSISRPGQMGPLWMHAGQISHMPIQHQLWIKDPPASSYPACVAVKTAQLQSVAYGDAYLQLLREASMGEGKNIARQSVLFDMALKFASSTPGFDLERFVKEYQDGSGMAAFKHDLQEVRFYNINRFPTLILKSADGKAVMLAGYRNYNEILTAIKKLVPEIEAGPA